MKARDAQQPLSLTYFFKQRRIIPCLRLEEKALSQEAGGFVYSPQLSSVLLMTFTQMWHEYPKQVPPLNK